MKVLFWSMKVGYSNFATSNQLKQTKMKKLLFLILAMMVFTLPSTAKGAKDNSSTKTIKLDLNQNGSNTDHDRHRAPMRINIEAYYDSETGSINICYDGEAAGEVYLYLNGDIVDYNSEINTTFQIHTTGMYKIEIHGASWIAEGYLNL